jgi:hypothetical protein
MQDLSTIILYPSSRNNCNTSSKIEECENHQKRKERKGYLSGLVLRRE